MADDDSGRSSADRSARPRRRKRGRAAGRAARRRRRVRRRHRRQHDHYVRRPGRAGPANAFRRRRNANFSSCSKIANGSPAICMTWSSSGCSPPAWACSRCRGWSAATTFGKRLDQTVTDLDTTIRDIRTAIFELRAPAAASLHSELIDTVEAAAGRPRFPSDVAGDRPDRPRRPGGAPPGDRGGCPRSAVQRRPPRPCTRGRGVGERGDRRVHADGSPTTGSGLSARSTGNGLANMRARAEERSGTFSIAAVDPHGTTLTWTVPIRPPATISKPSARDLRHCRRSTTRLRSARRRRRTGQLGPELRRSNAAPRRRARSGPRSGDRRPRSVAVVEALNIRLAAVGTEPDADLRALRQPE